MTVGEEAGVKEAHIYHEIWNHAGRGKKKNWTLGHLVPIKSARVRKVNETAYGHFGEAFQTWIFSPAS